MNDSILNLRASSKTFKTVFPILIFSLLICISLILNGCNYEFGKGPGNGSSSGGGSIQIIDIELAYMNNITNFNFLDITNISASVYNTINNADKDLYTFYFESFVVGPGENFSYPENENGILNLAANLADYSQHVRQEPEDYPYHIIFANIFDFPNTEPFPDNRLYLGTANSRANTIVPGYNQYSENYSYVFVQNIRDVLPSPTFNHQSVFNQMAAHELLHQIGNVWGDDAHDIHNPTDFPCVLRPPDYFRDNGYFAIGTTTDEYEICTDHIGTLSNELDEIKMHNNHYITSASNNSISSDNIKLQMNLKKTKYLKFEPVVALFEYINLGDKPELVYDAFDKYLDVLKLQVENVEDKTVYNHKNMLLHFTSSCMIKTTVLPGDTLKIPLVLNDYGKTISGRENYYFGNFGYFPAGKYKVVAVLKNDCSRVYDPPLISNEVYFEVEDVSADELSKIWVNTDVRNRNTSEITNDFKILYDKIDRDERKRGISNPFTEHLLFMYLNGFSGQNLRNPDLLVQLEIKKTFELFFNKFPDSFYLFTRNLLHKYLLNNNIVKEGDDEFLLNKLKSFIDNYPQLEVAKYLRGQIKRNKLPWKSE